MKYLFEVRRTSGPEETCLPRKMNRADYATMAVGLAGLVHPSFKLLHVFHEETGGVVKAMVESPLPLADVHRALESMLHAYALSAGCGEAVPPEPVVSAACGAAYRFIADSRDQATSDRLDDLEDPYRLFRCRTIMNCVDVWPKGLNPARAISHIRDMLVMRAV